MNITNIIILVSACLNALSGLLGFSIKIKIKLKNKANLKKIEKTKKALEQKLFNAWKEDYKKKYGKCEPTNTPTNTIKPNDIIA